MANLEVQPRNTPGERADAPVEVEVDEALAVHAGVLEEWAAGMEWWDLQLLQGHDFDRANNVEARLVFVEGRQTTSLTFRLDQLDAADQTGQDLVLRFEETDGIAKLVRLTPQGVDVSLHHILGALEL